jgi:hypothetical protein
MNCAADGVPMDPVTCACNYSPLIVQLTPGARYELTSTQNGVLFDHSGDGLKERTAWTTADSPVAFLALDRNGNGVIDDGTELFGNSTYLSDGRRAPNGFDALADTEANTPTADGVLDESDPVYGRLRLWLDRNHNGISETDELATLGDVGLTRIYLWYGKVNRRDRYGNVLMYQGKVLIASRGVELPRHIYDVFFKVTR